jgi:hypothetical protein
MAYKIPGLTQDIKDGVVELWDLILRNKTRVIDSVDFESGSTLLIEGTTVTAKAADLNLVAGLITGAITSGVVKYFEKGITCANGTAQTGAIVTIPQGAIILEVMTICTEAFNGNATKTFEVGITGNTDKYIDPVDCPVTLAGVMAMEIGTNNDQKLKEPLGAAMALIYTYTNTAAATTGKMKVKVVYC